MDQPPSSNQGPSFNPNPASEPVAPYPYRLRQRDKTCSLPHSPFGCLVLGQISVYCVRMIKYDYKNVGCHMYVCVRLSVRVCVCVCARVCVFIKQNGM